MLVLGDVFTNKFLRLVALRTTWRYCFSVSWLTRYILCMPLSIFFSLFITFFFTLYPHFKLRYINHYCIVGTL
jgi:hypothetical protein